MTEQALRLSAWLPLGDSGLRSFEANASKLTRVYPLWYRLGDEGMALHRQHCSAQARARVMEIAKKHGVEVWPQVSDFDESKGSRNPGRVARMLQDPKVLAFHRQSLERLTLQDQAQGVSVDYQVAEPQLQGMLDQFSATAPALNLLQLKAFEGAASGGAIASLELVGKLIKLALAERPAANVELGLPGFGYDFKGDAAFWLDYNVWDKLVAMHGPAKRDPASGELTLNAAGHQAWFVDSIALLGKLLKAREAGLDQVALWILGSEDPRIWNMLEDFPIPFAKVSHGL